MYLQNSEQVSNTNSKVSSLGMSPAPIPDDRKFYIVVVKIESSPATESLSCLTFQFHKFMLLTQKSKYLTELPLTLKWIKDH